MTEVVHGWVAEGVCSLCGFEYRLFACTRDEADHAADELMLAHHKECPARN